MANLQKVRDAMSKRDVPKQADASSPKVLAVEQPTSVQEDARGVRICVFLAGLLVTKYIPYLATQTGTLEADMDLDVESRSRRHVESPRTFRQMVTSLPERLVTGKPVRTLAMHE